MPAWAGRWKGGRYYLDPDGRRVYFIEKSVGGVRYAIKLATHDEELAWGELAAFLLNPDAFGQARAPKDRPTAVYITEDRIKRYLESIRGAVRDHRAARRAYLLAWSAKRLDLGSTTRGDLRDALEGFQGGYRGRVETLNAFANWLVREGELKAWISLVSHLDPKSSRAPREAYTIEQLQIRYRLLTNQRFKDLLLLRAETGMHYTEVKQLLGCRLQTGPLGDRGVAIRTLGDGHEIRGVLQVVHKSGKRHRQSVGRLALEAALRLRELMPARDKVWRAWSPIIPSNLRHTFVTLAGEVGRLVSYTGAGIARSQIAQAVGHRAGSTITADHYDQLQIPPMVVLSFRWDVLGTSNGG